MKVDDQKLLGGFVGFLIAMFMLVGVFGGSCSGPPTAAAQAVPSLDEAFPPADDGSITADLALGRTIVRESGTAGYRRDDGAAIHAVISFRADRLWRTDYLSALMRITNGAPLSLAHPRPWITELLPSADRPSLWPSTVRWERNHEIAWRRTYQHAIDLRRGEIVHRCRAGGEPMQPHSWGSEHDAIGYRRRNPTAVELDCGQTCTLSPDGTPRITRDGLPKCNHFFSLPRYEARFGGL